MKRSVDVMEILVALDLTHSHRAAAALAGCDHNTVARLRARGRLGELNPRDVVREERHDDVRGEVVSHRQHIWRIDLDFVIAGLVPGAAHVRPLALR